MAVVPLSASTSVALPVLPLPRLQKRNTFVAPPSPALLQVVDQQGHDALGRRAVLGVARRIEHLHRAAVAFGLDRHAVARRAFLLGVAHQAGEKAGLFLAGLRRVDVAHKVQALGAVTVFHGEAAAVEGQAHPAPGAVETIVHLQAGSRRVRQDAGPCRCRDGGGGDGRLGELFLGAQLDHDALQELGFELRIARARLPGGGFLLRTGVDLDQPAVADIDLAAGGGALDPRAELVFLTRGVQRVDQPTQGVADDVVGELGAVFGPLGFHHAGILLLEREGHAAVAPEGLQLRPQLLGGQGGDQPALRCPGARCAGRCWAVP